MSIGMVSTAKLYANSETGLHMRPSFHSIVGGQDDLTVSRAAVLDAAKKEFRREGFLVADPFSGGATVAFEAVRRGLPMYAQDLYPWPSQSLATTLTPAAPDEFKTAAAAVLEALSEQRETYWTLTGTCRWEITHVI